MVTAATMPLTVSVAKPTLNAGRKPPSAIFITRASTSVVEARGSGAFFFTVPAVSPPSGGALSRSLLRLASIRSTTAIAAVTRSSRSFAARSRCAACRRLSAPGSASNSSRNRRSSAAASRQRASEAWRRNEAAPAAARTRMPSCATRWSEAWPVRSIAEKPSTSSVSSTAPCATRKSASVL